MSNTRLDAIKERWGTKPLPVQCEDWWYSAVRHVQRNVMDVCYHERAYEPIEDGFGHPDRYEGERHAHAGADITYLLSLLGVDDE